MSASPTVTPGAQLEWEGRAGRVTAGAAFLAAVLALAALPLRARIVNGKDLDERFLSVHAEAGRYLAGAAIDALSTLLLIFVIVYLYRCTKARRAELLSATLTLGIGGSVAYAVWRFGSALVFVDSASDFSTSRIPASVSRITDPQAYLEAVDPLRRAERLAADSPAQTLDYLGLGSILAVAFSLLLLSLNAMRAGLLSRFMGVLGIVLAVLYGLGGGPPPVIYGFWLGALGALFLGRWPGGRGPAWETGEAVPWPSAAKMRAEATEEPPAPQRFDDPEPEGAAERPPHPVSRKRKKKRR